VTGVRDVIVVGAGPVGLTAALALRARGLPVTVIEEGAKDRVRPGSRAIFIHKASLLVLERIRAGLGRELDRHGLVWTTKRTFYRGQEVFSRSYPAPPPGKLPAATSLPQVVTEQVLLGACLQAGVDFVWADGVRRATAEPEGVVLQTASGAQLSARYVIAADGARSAVRESAGLVFEGPRTHNAFVIVDAAEDPAHPTPPERVFHYEHPAVEGRNVLLVPFAGHWRIDLQCHPGDDPERFSSAEGVRQWLGQVVRGDYADRITWVSTYIFRQAVANRFTDLHRRLLLVGEAAHVFAPFGARGLNSGIPDAFVAATAVHQALLAPTAGEAALFVDHFAAVRRRAALRNRAASNQALQHLTVPTLAGRLTRRVAGELACQGSRFGRLERFGAWLDRKPYGPVLGRPDVDGMLY
jgi:3-(3-hydroxy-phenyl)propionate hydroxylase